MSLTVPLNLDLIKELGQLLATTNQLEAELAAEEILLLADEAIIQQVRWEILTLIRSCRGKHIQLRVPEEATMTLLALGLWELEVWLAVLLRLEQLKSPEAADLDDLPVQDPTQVKIVEVIRTAIQDLLIMRHHLEVLQLELAVDMETF